MSRYFWTCPECGANLEPNERCEDCQDKKKEPNGGQPTRLIHYPTDHNGQLKLLTNIAEM